MNFPKRSLIFGIFLSRSELLTRLVKKTKMPTFSVEFLNFRLETRKFGHSCI